MTHVPTRDDSIDARLHPQLRAALLDEMSKLVNRDSLEARGASMQWSARAVGMSPDAGPAVPAPPRPRSSRTSRARRPHLLAVRLVLAALVVLAGTGVAAAAGLLPGPVEHQVTRVAKAVGITAHHAHRRTTPARVDALPPVEPARLPTSATGSGPASGAHVALHASHDAGERGQLHDDDANVDQQAADTSDSGDVNSGQQSQEHDPVDSTVQASTDGGTDTSSNSGPSSGQDSGDSGTDGSDDGTASNSDANGG